MENKEEVKKEELLEKNVSKKNIILIFVIIVGIIGIVAALFLPKMFENENNVVDIEEMEEENSDDEQLNTDNDENEQEESSDEVVTEDDYIDETDDTEVDDENYIPSKIKKLSEFTPQELVELVQLPTYGGVDEIVYVDGGVSFEKMSDYYKFSLAVKLIENENSYYDEGEIKTAFENLFGKNTYKLVSDITIGCMPHKYDSVNKRYIPQTFGCGGASTFAVHQEIYNVKSEGGVYKITTLVVYSNHDGYYKDAKTTKLISKDDNFDIKSYMNNNKDFIEQYTYTFNIVDGNYIYKGVSRTNNYK